MPRCHLPVHFIICEIMEKLYFGTVQLLLGEKKEMQYSRCFSPEIYDHSVALNQSMFFWGGRGDRHSFVLPLSCWFAIWLFYIKLSYVAIKDDFCKKKKMFALLCRLSVLFRFLLSFYNHRRSEGFVFHVKQMLRELIGRTLAVFINSNRGDSKWHSDTVTCCWINSFSSISTLSYLRF